LGTVPTLSSRCRKTSSFKRHCDTIEVHPLIHNCGDFFARGDSETQRARAILEGFLRTNKGIGIPILQIIKEKNPDSSKKRTKGRERRRHKGI
jgi:hypothetical protein